MSPNGGGLLTRYGRGLSEEVLSTWRQEGEGQFLWGSFKSPDWLNLGGDFRGMQLYTNTTAQTDNRFIFMQTDLEASVTAAKFDLVATAGHQDVPGPHSLVSEFVSRRHYLTYHASDEVAIRAGQFLPAFGINYPDHSLLVKQQLGFDQGTETYNVEGSWTGTNYDAFATAILGRPDAPSLLRDQGVALRASRSLADKYKVGLSYFYGDNGLANRHVAGPFAILGFTEKIYATAEMELQRAYDRTLNQIQFGWVDYVRLNYEFIRGISVYATQQLSQLDFSNFDTFAQAYGGGIEWFPRPHFEFQAFYTRQIFAATGQGTADVAGLMLHYYP
jgi:hypothetical protein